MEFAPTRALEESKGIEPLSLTASRFQIGVLVHAGRFPKVPGLFPRRSGSCTVFAVLKFVGLDKTKEGFRFEPSSGLPGDLARSRTENFFVCSEDPCRMARDHWGKGRDSNPHKGTVALRKLASCGKLRTHSRTLRTRVASRRAQRAAVHCIRNPRRFLTCAIPARFAGIQFSGALIRLRHPIHFYLTLLF